MKQSTKTLESIDHLQRAPMPDALRQKLLAGLRAGTPPRIITMSKPAVLAMAAGLAMLVGLNVYAVMRRHQSRPVAVLHGAQAIADDYFAPPPSI